MRFDSKAVVPLAPDPVRTQAFWGTPGPYFVRPVVMPELEGVAHIELTVRDPEASAEWYERVLGFTLRADHRRGNKGVIVMEHSSGIVLGFWQHQEQPNSDLFDEFRTGLDHIAFGASHRGQIEEWIHHFDVLGVQYSEPMEFGAYGVILTFRDPDNVQLEIFWDARLNPETEPEEQSP